MNNYRNNNRQFRSYRSGSSHDFRRRGFSKSKSIDESKFIKRVDTTKEAEVYRSTMQFEELNIHETLKKNIKFKGYTNPTPIQDKSIPSILKGKDVVGIANTGTGKTVAFLLPLIQKVIVNRKNKVIIIAPTRELAGQINDELYALTRNLNVFSVLCTGGSSLYNQIHNVQRGFNFIVGTPGRIKDLTDRNVLNLPIFSTIVLDEVDRMLDMGFVVDIKYIISKLAPVKQTLFFSATMNNSVEGIMRLILNKDYETVSVKTSSSSDSVNQDIVRVHNRDEKFPKLVEILKAQENCKVLIFVNTKRGVEKLCRKLRETGYKADSIHGDRRQRERERALEGFKNNKTDILVATDVAARGIDVSDISHVINFEAPNSYEDYVHRIGRTGRASKLGQALTFVERR